MIAFDKTKIAFFSYPFYTEYGDHCLSIQLRLKKRSLKERIKFAWKYILFKSENQSNFTEIYLTEDEVKLLNKECEIFLKLKEND